MTRSHGTMRSENCEPTTDNLTRLLSAASLQSLSPAIAAKFDEYLGLLLRWNVRMNLTAIREPGEILRRHFVESIACAQYLPDGIGSLLDFGTGAGFPGIPIALCRPEILVTLAESQGKKAAFLREAVRVLGLNSNVFDRRAEDLAQQFDCVTLRAVDQMDRAVTSASRLVRPEGWLAVMTTMAEMPVIQEAAGSQFNWSVPISLPGSDQRVLAVSSRAA